MTKTIKKNLKKELKLKNGLIFHPKETFEIHVAEDSPTMATLIHPYTNTTFKIRSISLHKYFHGFISPYSVLSNEDKYSDAIIPSLTGEDVEPDGWDEKGFPSIFLAAGMI